MAKKTNRMLAQSFAGLSPTQLVALKKVLSDVNNVVTLRLTLNFIDRLAADRVISDRQQTLLRNRVLKTHVNANGFDVAYSGTVAQTRQAGILAEVKGSVPANGTTYGGAQQKSIAKDIGYLLGANKAAKVGQLKGTFGKYYKFLVLLDDGSCRQAISNIMQQYSSVLAPYNPQQLDRTHIFVVPIQL